MGLDAQSCTKVHLVRSKKTLCSIVISIRPMKRHEAAILFPKNLNGC